MQSKSFYLDPDSWDITLDGSGQMKISNNPYSIAQDVACAVKVIRGECYFDNTLGLRYYDELMGQPCSTGTVTAAIRAEAMKITTVSNASVTIIPDQSTRTSKVYIEITDTNHTSSVAVL